MEGHHLNSQREEMSRCWCKCEAGLGQCGPKVPLLQTVFSAHKQADRVPPLRGDRQAELQAIWDALEEGVRRRTALEETVSNSEKRLAEILGPESAKLTALSNRGMEYMLSWLSTQEALQSAACAPSPLPLQTRLDMARLHELDKESLGPYGWLGELLVMVELRHQVLLLRETVNLPSCVPVLDLDKIIVKTIEDLSSLYPHNRTAILPCNGVATVDQKPVMQAMRQDGEGFNDHMENAAQLRLRKIEEKRKARKRIRDVQRTKSESPLGMGNSKPCSVSKLQNGQSVIHKVNTLNQQLNFLIKDAPEAASSVLFQEAILPDPVRSLEGPAPAGRLTPVSSPPHSAKNSLTPTGMHTQTSCNLSISSSPSAVLSDQQLQQPAEIPIDAAGLHQADILLCKPRERQGPAKIKPADLFGARMAVKGLPKHPSKSPGREPLRNLPNCTIFLTTNSAAAAQGMRRPPPPPPPPPMPLPGSTSLFPKKTSKLKRSVKISRLYRNLKTKIEGVAHGHITTGLGSSSRRLSTCGTREGMAEALAEITKKSTYFQKIENDVQKYRDAIEESKTAVDNFETEDMDHLLRFHKKMESILENLTDESQVLGRFKGFPSNKLETLRLAAALYSRLLSMEEALEKWAVRAPVAAQLDKITRYFDKIKKELELVESTKDDDLRRFTNQKIKFDFSILGRIKEAMVGLSSRCLVQALEESKLTSSLDGSERDFAHVDSGRQRLYSQMLWRAFQLAYRVYNFAGGHDDQSERLISDIASKIDSFPVDVWL